MCCAPRRGWTLAVGSVKGCAPFLSLGPIPYTPCYCLWSCKHNCTLLIAECAKQPPRVYVHTSLTFHQRLTLWSFLSAEHPAVIALLTTLLLLGTRIPQGVPVAWHLYTCLEQLQIHSTLTHLCNLHPVTTTMQLCVGGIDNLLLAMPCIKKSVWAYRIKIITWVKARPWSTSISHCSHQTCLYLLGSSSRAGKSRPTRTVLVCLTNPGPWECPQSPSGV